MILNLNAQISQRMKSLFLMNKFSTFVKRPKYLPLTKTPDRFLLYAYTVFLNKNSYNNLLIDLSNSKRIRLEKLEEKIRDKIIENLGNRHIFEKLDKSCISLLPKLDIPATLRILSGFHILCGLQTFASVYFGALIRIWSKHVSDANESEAVMMLFYCSQTKPVPTNILQLLNKRFEKISNLLTLPEFVIICNCFFKLKIKMSTSLLDQIWLLMKETDFQSEDDKFGLLSILKATRSSQYFNKDLCYKLADFSLNNAASLNAAQISHILATFANVKFYDHLSVQALNWRFFIFLREYLTKPLQKGKMEAITKQHLSIRPRSKDVARFLWSISLFQHHLSKGDMNTLVKILDRFLDEGEYKEEPQYLVDSLQSLILFQCFPDNLLHWVFSEDFIKRCMSLKKAKPLHQIHFLSNSVELENSSYQGRRVTQDKLKWLSRFLRRSSEQDMENREGFKDAVCLIKDTLELKELNCYSPLPHIPIIGIVLQVRQTDISGPDWIQNIHSLQENEKLTSIEILDPTNCIYGTSKPTGLLVTKIRQLKSLNINVLCLNQNEISFYKKNPGILKSKILELNQ